MIFLKGVFGSWNALIIYAIVILSVSIWVTSRKKEIFSHCVSHHKCLHAADCICPGRGLRRRHWDIFSWPQCMLGRILYPWRRCWGRDPDANGEAYGVRGYIRLRAKKQRMDPVSIVPWRYFRHHMIFADLYAWWCVLHIHDHASGETRRIRG